MKSLREYIEIVEDSYDHPTIGDIFEMEIARDETLIKTYIIDVVEDGFVIEADDTVIKILEHVGYLFENPTGMPPDTSTISPIHSSVNKEHSEDTDLEEAEYRGRNVPLGKKMKGDVKKSKVYVKKPNGNVVKVEFGDPNMRIKKSNPKRRKSFRARHNCDNPGPRWKARYWSCRSW